MSLSTSSTFAPPISSARASAVILGANRSVPQGAGTTITWTATPCGGRGPYEYKWLLYNGSEWDVVKNWSEANTFRWTPVFANPRYRVAVWVRGAGSSVDDFDATTEAAFAIDEVSGLAPFAPAAMSPGTSAPVQPVSTVTLAANPSPPQPVGTTIDWTASATGGGAGRQYKWFVYDGSRWKVASSWSTSDTLRWTPLRPNPRYRIAVWARSAGSITDYFEACAEVEFAVNE